MVWKDEAYLKKWLVVVRDIVDSERQVDGHASLS